jgi:hypothetical protein
MNLQKLRLGQLKPSATTEAGDTHFSKVTAMFNFDGSDTATTTTGLDASNKNLTISYGSGDQLSNTQKKFGATSIYVADGIELSSSDGFNMGTGDFTMEAWYYFTDFSQSYALFDQWQSSGSYRHQIWTGKTSAGTAGRLDWYYANTSKFSTANPAVSTGAWTHIACVRHSGTLKIYINGTAESNTQSYTGQFGRTAGMAFGDQLSGGASGRAQYYLDDLRITKGLARYTSNFTAPTTAHLTTGGDSLKQVIVNEDADGVIVGTGGINPVWIAKAWVNFNGTSTLAIRSSYNISSITDNGTGDYTANLSTALSDTNGAAVAMTGYIDHTWGMPLYKDVSGSTPLTTTQFRVATVEPETTSVTYFDQEQVSILIFGN